MFEVDHRFTNGFYDFNIFIRGCPMPNLHFLYRSATICLLSTTLAALILVSTGAAQNRSADIETRLRGAATGQGLLQLTDGEPFTSIFVGDRQVAMIDRAGSAFAYLDAGQHTLRIVSPSGQQLEVSVDIFMQSGQIFSVNLSSLSSVRGPESGMAAFGIAQASWIGGSAGVPGSVFQECAYCPEMVVIPSGSFTMGSPSNEVGRRDNESPRREVRIARPFAMGVYEVTFAQWDACAAAGYCTRGVDDRGWGRGARPVINVSWDDVQAFLRWMNSLVDGNPYRLPSEAEWEYAARAGSDTAFWWGNRISPDQANYSGTSAYNNGPTGVYREQTLPVGSFAANPFGLFDVHGNVWEWVQDCYADSYAGAPTDGSARSSSGCSARVLRGGSWISYPWDLRSAVRSRGWPDFRSGDRGFRLARTLTP